MARCCGGGCSCRIEGGSNVVVSGIGSSGNPFVISTDVSLLALDTDVFDVSVTGAGTAASPWVVGVAYKVDAQLTDIPDVSAVAPTNAQVLGWDASIARWTPRNPTTAASGSVVHDTSLTGDGSAGSPLQVVEDPLGLLTTGASGVGLTSAGKNQLVRKFADATARAAASPAPTLNSLSMLDTVPGRTDYWTGSQWLPVEGAVSIDGDGEELLNLSGSYVEGMPTTMLVRKFSGTTGADGQFTIIPPATIASRAGVLAVTVTATGSQAYVPIVSTGTNYVFITARRVDDGAVLASQAISGQYVAYVY
jgi:hypothetical protein